MASDQIRDTASDSRLTKQGAHINPVETLNGRGIASANSPNVFSSAIMSLESGDGLKSIEQDVSRLLSGDGISVDQFSSNAIRNRNLSFTASRSTIGEQALSSEKEFEDQVTRLPEYVLRAIEASNSIAQAQFAKETQKPFYTKSLSLQYFVADELKNLRMSMQDMGKMLEAKLEAIKINTSASDARKATLGQKVKEILRVSTANSFADKVVDVRDALSSSVFGRPFGEIHRPIVDYGIGKLNAFKQGASVSDILTSTRLDAGGALNSAGTKLAETADKHTSGLSKSILQAVASGFSQSGHYLTERDIPDPVKKRIDDIAERVRRTYTSSDRDPTTDTPISELRRRRRSSSQDSDDPLEDTYESPEEERRETLKAEVRGNRDRLDRASEAQEDGRPGTVFGLLNTWYNKYQKVEAVSRNLLELISKCSCKDNPNTSASAPPPSPIGPTPTPTPRPITPTSMDQDVLLAAYLQKQNGMMSQPGQLPQAAHGTRAHQIANALHHPRQAAQAAVEKLRHPLQSASAAMSAAARGVQGQQTRPVTQAGQWREIRVGRSWDDGEHLVNPENTPEPSYTAPGTYTNATPQPNASTGSGPSVSSAASGVLREAEAHPWLTGIGTLAAAGALGKGRFLTAIPGLIARGSSIPKIGRAFTYASDMVSPLARTSEVLAQDTMRARVLGMGKIGLHTAFNLHNPLFGTAIGNKLTARLFGEGLSEVAPREAAAAGAKAFAERAATRPAAVQSAGVVSRYLSRVPGLGNILGRVGEASAIPAAERTAAQNFTAHVAAGHGLKFAAANTAFRRFAPGHIVEAAERFGQSRAGSLAMKGIKWGTHLGRANLASLAGMGLGIGTDIVFKNQNSAANIGGHIASGALSGAGTGALIGSVIPVVGTAAGAAIGGGLGAAWEAGTRIPAVQHFIGNVGGKATEGALAGAAIGKYIPIPKVGAPLGAAVGASIGALLGLASYAKTVGSGFKWAKDSLFGRKTEFNPDGSIKDGAKGGLFQNFGTWLLGSDAKVDPITGFTLPPKLSLAQRMESSLRWLFNYNGYRDPGTAPINESTGGLTTHSTNVDPNSPTLAKDLGSMSVGAPGYVSPDSVSHRPGFGRADNRKISDQPEYKAILSKLPKDLQDYISKSQALQFMAWSTSVQSGADAAAQIIKQSYQPDQDVKTFIKRVYQSRSAKLPALDPAMSTQALKALGAEESFTSRAQSNLRDDGSATFSFGEAEDRISSQVDSNPEDFANSAAARQGRAVGGSASQTDIRTAMRFFMSKGWSQAQAAGIVANLVVESGLHPIPAGSNDNGIAHGIAQWHDHRSRYDRVTPILKAFRVPSIESMSLPQQLEAVQWELTQGGEVAAGNGLKRITDAKEAGAYMSRAYERPADVEGNMRSRGALAENLFRQTPQTVGDLLGTADDATSSGGAPKIIAQPDYTQAPSSGGGSASTPSQSSDATAAANAHFSGLPGNDTPSKAGSTGSTKSTLPDGGDLVAKQMQDSTPGSASTTTTPSTGTSPTPTAQIPSVNSGSVTNRVTPSTSTPSAPAPTRLPTVTPDSPPSPIAPTPKPEPETTDTPNVSFSDYTKTQKLENAISSGSVMVASASRDAAIDSAQYTNRDKQLRTTALDKLKRYHAINDIAADLNTEYNKPNLSESTVTALTAQMKQLTSIMEKDQADNDKAGKILKTNAPQPTVIAPVTNTNVTVHAPPVGLSLVRTHM